jgi:uncharacterized membrane protein YeaQ/YmgE (transglycosylase-associated protein family)
VANLSGALAGMLAGHLITFSKRGFGLWANVGLGWSVRLSAEIKITFEDLISAFVGSLLCIITWRLIRKDAAPRKHQKSGG